MISVIIPNLNGVQHLKTCFESLRRQTKKDFKTYLVDNNSSDSSIEFIQNNFPEVEIFKLDSNKGFAQAVNIGIKHSLKDAEVDYIVLLNNDVECDKNFINELSNCFISGDVGSGACKMLNYFDRTIIDNAGDFIKKRGSPFARGHAEKDNGQFNKAELIWGACAGAAIYKREMFERVGFFDEDFFAYYEDVDFNFRMQLAGYKCYYNPRAICYHKRGSTSKSKTGFETMLCEKNLIAVRLKNYPFNILFRWIPFFIARRIQRYFLFIRDHSFKVFLSAVRGYLWGLIEIPKSLAKRGNIQKQIKVTSEYIENMFY